MPILRLARCSRDTLFVCGLFVYKRQSVLAFTGDDIHYGLFKGDPEKTGEGLKESSQNSVEALAEMAVKCKALEKVGDSAFGVCRTVLLVSIMRLRRSKRHPELAQTTLRRSAFGALARLAPCKVTCTAISTVS